jgi:tetratricopeptide (TPR) repeat protein/tRNA A-37 threonylcarbamoyl transferase component Bud32
MGEAESFERDTLADVPATAADDGDAAARTVGADSADTGPADIDVESGDGRHAPLGSEAEAGDATQGLADLTATTGAGATALTAADSPGSHAGAGGSGAALRTEPTFGPPPDPAAATEDRTRDTGPPVAPGDVPPEAVGLRAAPTIPGYEILGELGRGGMGVVYQARQVRLNRAVALKMILAGAHAGAEAAARFFTEAEAVAQLQHPNIVQIFHIDEHAGFPYFEMEFVGGGSLADRLDGTPRPPREAAWLTEILARAMAEAHRRGIVHRDLKPGNILLTPEGAPKVADFGLAKLLNAESGLTRTDSVLGSPSYMAPEQAGGKTKEVGLAADVYALGAILYELLTGRPPFRGATALETLEQVKTTEPVPPSRLVPGLPRDAETIALKCLEKDPSRRYPTAEALADDLRRFLDGRSILARPSPIWERVAKWARRRPGLATTLGGVAVAISVVFAGILYYNSLLRAGVQTTRAAKADADRNASVALEQRNLALKALDKLVFEVQERLGETPATRSLRRSLLDTAIVGLDEIASNAEATPPDLSRAVAHQRLGEIYRQVGRSAEASRQLEQATRLAEQLARATPRELAVKDCLSRAHVGLGEIHLRADQTDLALTHFHRVVELAEEIAAADTGRPGVRRGLLEAYLRLGRAHGFQMQLDEARAWFQKASALAQRWCVDEPGNAEAAAMLAWSYRKIADIGKLSGDFDAARSDYLKAIAVGRESLESHPKDAEARTHLATALNDLAGVLHLRRDLAGAGPLYAEAEKLFEDLAEADPENADILYGLIHAQYDLARLQRDLARFSEAAGAYRRAIGSLGRFPGDRLSAHTPADFLQIEVLQRDLADCESAPLALEALAPLQSRPTPDASALLLARVRLLSAMGRPDDALEAVEAVCSLNADKADDLAALTLGLGECARILDDLRFTGPIGAHGLAVRRRCTERAVSLLALAVERGFVGGSRLEYDSSVKWLHREPSFLSLVERLKSSPPIPNPSTVPRAEGRH